MAVASESYAFIRGKISNLCVSGLNLSVGFAFAAEEPGDKDRHNVEYDHRRREKHHVRDVVGRRSYGSYDKDDYYGDLPAPEEESRRNYTDPGQDVGYRGHLEDQPHRQYHQRDEIEIVGGPQHQLK